MNNIHANNMNDEYIKQHDLVSRYLHNKLTPEETVEFEEYILDKPEILEQLELDSVLIETLPMMQMAEPQSPDNKIGLKLSILQVLFGTPIKASLYLMLSLTIVSTISWKVLYPITNTFLPSTQNQIIYLETLRAIQPSPNQITIKENTELLIFVLQPNNLVDREFSAQINQINNENALFSFENIFVSNTGELILAIPASTFSSDNYEIEIVGLSTKQIQNIFLSIKRAYK